MPTLSKLLAAVAFACVGLFAAEAFKAGMPQGTKFSQFVSLSAVIGLLCGWFVMGRLTGKGYAAAAGSGVRTSVTLLAWALLLFSVVLMVRKAFRKRYDGPMEALVDIFALALEHGLIAMTVPVLATLGVGGVMGGLLAEWAKRRWD